MRMSSGPVEAEAETACRVVDLRRADAQVEQDTRHTRRRQLAEPGKTLVPDPDRSSTTPAAASSASGSLSKATRRPCGPSREQQIRRE
jgi:hypothetical protein